MAAGDETIPLGKGAPARGGGDPARIGPFAVRGRLGEGAMGVVFLGRDETLERDVALKLVHPELAGPDARTRMLREAQAMARVAHPNVVAIYEAGVHDDSMYIAMELIEGSSFAEWLAIPRPPREVLARLVESGRALAAAHRAGVLHRDFKPANVLIGADGRARVLDFGLARAPRGAARPVAASGALAAELTQDGTIVGTPAYMAPEQFEGEASEASDQWSFAVTCYRALFGAMPFAGDGFVALMAAIQTASPAVPHAPPDLPPEVVDTVMRGLRREPGERWPSIAAMVGALEAVLARDPTRDPTRTRRQRRVLAACMTAVVVAGGAVMIVRTRFGRDVSTVDSVIPIAIALAALAAVTWWLRASVLRDAHGRRVVLFWFVLLAALGAHRLLELDAPVVRVLRDDAVLVAALAVVGGAAIERWLAWFAALMAAFLAVSFAAPRASFPAFGIATLAGIALALWFWRPRPPQ